MPDSSRLPRRALVRIVAVAVLVAALLAVALVSQGHRLDADAHPQPSPPTTLPVYRGPSPPVLRVQLARAVDAARASDAWYAELDRQAAEAEVSRETSARARDDSSPTSGTVGSAATAGPSGYPCGGDLPPCWVLDRESGYNDGDPFTYDIHAYNPTGCGGRGCYGKWQCDPRSCDGTGSEAEQDAEARRLWDGGRGCGHWGACRG